MLKVIEDESAIKKYQRQFVKSFKPFIDDEVRINLGHPGGAFRAKVFWSNRLGIWIFHDKISKSRRGHAFGIGKPIEKSQVSITCEINFPLSGIDRRMGAALAKDREGRTFVVHRGIIGGGRKGVGKSLFERYYRGGWAMMEDGEVDTPVALVGVLDSPRFVRHISQFIRKVSRIKSIISHRSPQVEITFDEPLFREELVGFGYDRLDGNSDSDCDHGLVVTDLHDTLKQDGFKIGNGINYDLFIINAARRITAVFQVMTDHSEAAIYRGLSMLLLSTIDLPDKPRLVLAGPRGIDQTLSAKLKKLDIYVLEYEWEGEQAVFPGLSALT